MFPPALTLLLCAAGYLLFFGLLGVAKKRQANRLFGEQGLATNTRLLSAVHVGGIVLFGVGPALGPQPPAFIPGSLATGASLPAMLTGLLAVLLSLLAWWLGVWSRGVVVYFRAELSHAPVGQFLHGSARTTAATRRAIQPSQESLQSLATRYSINPKTGAKWRKRPTVRDARMGPAPVSTVLSIEQEAIAGAFRRHTLLALDDCF